MNLCIIEILEEEREKVIKHAFAELWLKLPKSEESHTHTHRYTHTHTHTHRYTHTQTHTHRDTHRDTHTHRHTHRDTHTETHTHTQMYIHIYIKTCLAPVSMEFSKNTKLVAIPFSRGSY